MPKFTFDGKEYDTDHLSEDSKARFASLQFCDAEIRKLQMNLAAMQTAATAYAHALKAALEQGTSAATKSDTSSNQFEVKSDIISFGNFKLSE